MSSRQIAGGPLVVFVALIWLSTLTQGVSAPAQQNAPAGALRIVAVTADVEGSAKGGTDWIFTQTGQVLKPGYRLRTGTNSHVVLRWPDDSTVRFGELTEVEILPPRAQSAESGLHLFSGIFSFFHPRKRSDLYTITRGSVAGIKGTEFVMRVDTVNNVESTTLYVIDGSVELTNEFGAVSVNNGQQAVANVGQAPELLTAGFNANNILQWCFYYPAVLDLRDLPLGAAEQQALAGSLGAYRSGDLLAALAQYPAGRAPATDAERIYYAALLLSVGQVPKTEAALANLPANADERLARLATALRQLIAAVKRQPSPPSAKASATA